MKIRMTRIGALSVLLAAALSCQKEPMPDGCTDATPGLVVEASIADNLTKTALDGDDTAGYDVVWTKGDSFIQYKGYDSGSYSLFSLAGDGGSKTASFIETSHMDGRPILSIFPASIVDMSEDRWMVSDYVANVIWPDEIVWTGGTVHDCPMLSEDTSPEGPYSFRNAGGLFRIRAAGSGTLSGIELSADEPLAGAATLLKAIGSGTESIWSVSLDDQSPELLSRTITLTCADPVILTDEGVDFYIPMIPGTYNNLKLKFSFVNKGTAECVDVVKKCKKPVVIERSVITPASLNVSPFGTLKGTGTPVVLSKSQIKSSVVDRIAAGTGLPSVLVNGIFGAVLDKIIPDKDVTITKLEYYTPTPDGGITVASGLTAWTSDVSKSKTYGRLVSVQHGTCDIDQAPSTQDFSVELTPVFQANGSKYDNVVVMADYLGYGSSRTADLQTTYMHAGYTATACVDMIKAAESYLASNMGYGYTDASSKPIALCGYSQGGQASMATMFELQELGYTSRIADVKAGAGPLNLISFFDRFKSLAGKEYALTGYIPYMIRGILYGEDSDIDIHKLLAPEVFVPNAEGVVMYGQFSTTMLDTWHAGLGSDITKVLHPDFFIEAEGTRDPAVDEFISLAYSNSIINCGFPANPGVVTLYHETEDDQVPYECSVSASEKWGCALEDLTIAKDNHFLGAIEFYLKYLGDDIWSMAYEALAPFLSMLT